MPKHGFLTPKAIANRIKSKGLQKLCFYCQCCQKQCRDANGFKCHLTSEGHLRQMKLVSENPNKIIEEFSKEFERSYVDLLSRRFGVRRVNANHVYMELIADKQHMHMNATMWSTLQDFVKYLGRTGTCIVDQTEKGWYIQWIDRNPAKMKLKEEMAKREQQRVTEEERVRRQINRQIAAAEKNGAFTDRPTSTTISSDYNGDLELSLKVAKKPLQNKLLDGAKRKSSVFTLTEQTNDSSPSSKKTKRSDSNSSKPMSAMDQILYQEKLRRKAAKQREKEIAAEEAARAAAKAAPPADAWLSKGIIVKILNKKVAKGKYYKKKGEVVAIHDHYVGTVQLSSAKIKIDQDDLETVIPAIGRQVCVLQGRHRGQRGTLKVRRYCAWW